MSQKDNYLHCISARGDRYGRCGGVLDLLIWCGKSCTRDVELDEARFFFEHPDKSYEAYISHENDDSDAL